MSLGPDHVRGDIKKRAMPGHAATVHHKQPVRNVCAVEAE